MKPCVSIAAFASLCALAAYPYGKSAVASPHTTPVPSPSATTLFLAPDAAPQILDYRLSPTSVRSGGTISGFVRTSSNVASVEVRIGGFGTNMTKVGVDRFTVAYRIPYLPGFMRRTYTLEIIARNTRGDAVTRYVPLKIE